MIQADLRTARQHPGYGMNALILAAIVMAAIAALGALAHVLDGLFFMRRTSDAFIRFVSVWDIAIAFLGYLACAAGLSRHRIFPWLYLAFAIGFLLPRLLTELQANGVDVGMSQALLDRSFLQETHLLQLLAVLLCIATVYILWSPAVRITYRQRLTRDEVRLIEQMQGADPRLSLGPRGASLDAEEAAAQGMRHHRTPARPDAPRSRTFPPEQAPPEQAPPDRSQPGSARREAPLPGVARPDAAQHDAPAPDGEVVLVRRRGRSAFMAESNGANDEPLPALPSFFQAAGAGTDASSAAGQVPDGSASGEPPTAGSAGAEATSREQKQAAALAAATVAGALKRVSGRTSAAAAGSARPAVPEAPAAVALSAAAPAQVPTYESAAAAAGAIIAGAQRRTSDSSGPAAPPTVGTWSSAGSSAEATIPQPAPAQAPQEAAQQELARQELPRQELPSRDPVPQESASPAPTEPPPASPEAPPPAAPPAAPPPVADDGFDRAEDAAKRQLEAAAARQKLQEELEIDRRIARLRGLASGQVSALSIGLAMDRNPMAEDIEEEEGVASDGAARSTTDERLGRLRAAAAPPRNRGDSIRRRQDQNLSEELPAMVHSLAIGETEENLQGGGDTARPAGAGLGAGPSHHPATGASFQSRIDALLSRADANQSWQGGSMPDQPEEEAQPGDLPERDEAVASATAAGDWTGHDSPDSSALPSAAMPAQAAPAAAVPFEPASVPDQAASPAAGHAYAADAGGAERQAAAGPAPDAASPAQAADDFGAVPPGPAFASGSLTEGRAFDEAEFDLPRPAGALPGLAPLSPEPEPSAAPDDAAPDDVVPESAGSDIVEPPQWVAVPTPPSDALPSAPPSAPAPMDQAELAQSLSEFLPSATPAPGGAGGIPPDGESGAEDGDAASRPEERELVDQRIDAMRILVDEGFLSQAEFERRAAALREGG